VSVKIVVVSNRVFAGPKAKEPMTGGLRQLYYGCREIRRDLGGSSGRVRDGNQKEFAEKSRHWEPVRWRWLDLPAAHYAGYTKDLRNSETVAGAEFPSRLIARPQEDEITSAIAKGTRSWRARWLTMTKADLSILEVQDYSFSAIGAELRDIGAAQTIGFFMPAQPWPKSGVLGGVRIHRELIEADAGYDLDRFQTEGIARISVLRFSHDMELDVTRASSASR